LPFLVMPPMVGQVGEYMEITAISAEYAPFWQSGYTPKVVSNIC